MGSGNHPHWESQRRDGIARLDPIHDKIISKKYLHGIEVVNMSTFSEEAMQIALDNNHYNINNVLVFEKPFHIKNSEWKLMKM